MAILDDFRFRVEAHSDTYVTKPVSEKRRKETIRNKIREF